MRLMLPAAAGAAVAVGLMLSLHAAVSHRTFLRTAEALADAVRDLDAEERELLLGDALRVARASVSAARNATAARCKSAVADLRSHRPELHETGHRGTPRSFDAAAADVAAAQRELERVVGRLQRLRESLEPYIDHMSMHPKRMLHNYI